MMSLENYKTWSWVGILAGILVIVFYGTDGKTRAHKMQGPERSRLGFLCKYDSSYNVDCSRRHGIEG